MTPKAGSVSALAPEGVRGAQADGALGLFLVRDAIPAPKNVPWECSPAPSAWQQAESESWSVVG